MAGKLPLGYPIRPRGTQTDIYRTARIGEQLDQGSLLLLIAVIGGVVLAKRSAIRQYLEKQP